MIIVSTAVFGIDKEGSANINECLVGQLVTNGVRHLAAFCLSLSTKAKYS